METTPMTEPVRVPVTLVPLVELELSLPAPVFGWGVELDRRHITVLVDDIGRDSITRADARLLLTEQREDEARRDQMRQEAERRAIEADREFRASLIPGIPWYDIGRDITPAAAILEAAQDHEYAGRPRSVAAQLLESELSGGPREGYVSLQDEQP